MAILVTIETDSGLIVENAYGKITSVGGGKNGAVIELKYYRDVEASTTLEPIKVEYYNFIPSVDDTSDNFIKQGYEHIKTREEFEHALDV